MGWGYAPQVSIRCFYPLPRLSREERGFVREVFERMVVEGPELASITPKALYSPLFVLDRRERFGGDFCSMAPRAGAQGAVLHNPRTGEPLSVPALVLPSHIYDRAAEAVG